MLPSFGPLPGIGDSNVFSGSAYGCSLKAAG